MTFHCLWSPKPPSKGRHRSPEFLLQAALAAPATMMQNPKALVLGVYMKQRWEPRSWRGSGRAGCISHALTHVVGSSPHALPFPGGYKYFPGEPWTPGQLWGMRGCSPASGCSAQKPALSLGHGSGACPMPTAPAHAWTAGWGGTGARHSLEPVQPLLCNETGPSVAGGTQLPPSLTTDRAGLGARGAGHCGCSRQCTPHAILRKGKVYTRNLSFKPGTINSLFFKGSKSVVGSEPEPKFGSCLCLMIN